MSNREKEQLELALEVYQQKLDGASDLEIRDALELNEEAYTSLLRFMHKKVAESEERKTAGEVFSEYLLEQRRTIKKIDDIVDVLTDKKQSNALIGALRLRKDIVDTLLEKGQELGVYEKKPKKIEFIDGKPSNEMSVGELKEAVAREIGFLKEHVRQFGDGDIRALPVGGLYDEEQEVVIETTAEPVEAPTKKKVNRKPRKKKAKRRVSK